MAPRSDPQRIGAQDYPYDATVSSKALDGLDRLRAVQDRKLAEYLFVLYAQAVRNSSVRGDLEPSPPDKLAEHRRNALRALGGDLGPDARELAAYLLLDDAGRPQLNDEQLQRFAARLRALTRGRG